MRKKPNEYSANDYRYYLAHHGILGMKWGIRRFQNQDGSLTDEGRERYGYQDQSRDDRELRVLSRIVEKGNYLAIKEELKRNPVVQKLNKDPELESARKELREVDTEYKKYATLPNKEIETYLIMAADKRCEDEGYTSLEDRKNIQAWYLYDDGNQGSYNAFDMYLADHGINSRDYGTRVEEADQKVSKISEKLVSNLNADKNTKSKIELYLEGIDQNDGYSGLGIYCGEMSDAECEQLLKEVKERKRRAKRLVDDDDDLAYLYS